MNLRRVKELYYGIDGVLLLLCLLILAFSLFYFFKDDGAINEHAEMTPVGKFVTSHNDVRRRIQSGFSWANISRQEVVFEGDSIFTGDDSEASIELDGGGRLAIDPKSLVVVKTQGKTLQLDLQYGSMIGKVNAGSTLVISQNGQLQELSGKDAEVRIESVQGSKDTKIQVMRGEVKLKKVGRAPAPKPKNDLGDRKVAAIPAPVVEQPDQVIHQSEVVDLHETAAPVVEKVEAEIVSPNDGKMIWLTADAPLDLQWKLINQSNKKAAAGTSSRIEFAHENDFAQPLYTTTSHELKFTLPLEKRPKGKFFWRVQILDSAQKPEGLASASAALTLYPDVPPNPVFPADTQEFAFDPLVGEKGKQILLSWEDQAGSIDYDVQLATESTFKTPLVDKQTKSLSEQTEFLPTGTYYWRVRGRHPQRIHSDWSRVALFNVDKEAHQPLAPRLADLDLKYEIPNKVLAQALHNSALAGRGVQPQDMKPFTWSKVDDTESYEIELAATESFANSIKHSTGVETSFSPQEVKPGTVFARVRARGRKGLVSPPSEPGRLEVSLPQPDLHAVAPQTDKFATQKELDDAHHDFKLEWSPMAFAETYELDWGADTDFAKSKKFRLKGTDRVLTVTQAKDYSARVRAMGADGLPLSPYSAVQVVSYRKELLPPPPPPPVKAPAPVVQQASNANAADAKLRKPAMFGQFALPTPGLLEPLRASSFVSLDDSVPFMNLKWRSIKGAESYEVQMAQDADFTQIVSSYKATRSAYLVKQALPEGRIFWRVRAISKAGTSDWSNVYDLNVLYQ